MRTCILCQGQRVKIERRGRSLLTVYRCPDCGHRTAEHGQTSPNSADYHLQYEQKNFVDSLRQTRIRQANLIYEHLLRLGQSVDRVVDVGSGRGWFLETLKNRGVVHLAGMENSPVGLSTLQALNIAGIETDVSLKFSVDRVPFAPRIVCFLDVLEHFTGSLHSRLAPFMETFQDSLEWIVVKVPVSNGLLYRIANGLARLGWFKPLAQLYQVGTFPPHYHYFSAKSLQELAHKNPSIASFILGDPDFEPASFRDRFWSAPEAVREICGVIGGCLYGAGRLFKLYDSHILFLDLRPAKASRSENLLKGSSRNIGDVIG